MHGPAIKTSRDDEAKAYQPTSRQLLQALEAMAGVGFCTLSLADGTVQASDGLHLLTGTLDHVGQPVTLDFIGSRTHPDDRESLVENFHLLMRDIMPSRRDMRLLREDGTVRRLEMRFERLIDDERRPVGWIICVLDRSEEESLRHMLAQARRRLRTVLDQIDVDLAWFSSLDGRFVERVKQSGNPHLPQAPLFTLESWFDTVHPDDRPIVLEGLERAEADTSVIRIEISPGHYVPVRTIRKPVLNEANQAEEWFGLTSLVQPGTGGLDPGEIAADPSLNGPLLRGARNLLGWTIPVLAQQSGISASTIMRIEESSAPMTEIARRSTAERLIGALTGAGLTFHRTLTGKLAISL
ncbi:hypothetical protein SAMN05216456_2968 [Devosia crocina]|uniref:histidine kinase n=1 Tax=Devosia crocina TaxID=429728 RepID=A0A1I7NS98_9HYPH|nr:hypothetical protein [Devosia crocina]SFV37526.1 hypothetical protein SAMN05216456_2968 [Devosia crocina]